METNKDSGEPGDLLADALLKEHARLGTGNDEKLISAVLSRTVAIPRETAPMPRAASSPQPLGGFEWIKVAAIVIAFVGATVYFLDKRPAVRAQAVPERKQETFHFVIKVVEKSEDRTESQRKTGSSPVRPAGPGAGSLEVEAIGPGFGAPELADADLSPPGHDFGRSIDRLPAISSVRSSFVLASNESAKTGDRVTYSGDVVLSHEEFTLRAESLVMSQEGRGDEIPVVSARNANLVHNGGVYETTARSILFDPETGRLVASGVRRLVRNGAEQAMDDDSARVFFGSDDFVILH